MGLDLAGYTELRVLGTGATGTVSAARHDATGTLVAIKRLSPALGHDPQFRERFRAEAVVLAGLVHPNVVRLYAYLEDGAEAAMLLELIDGVSLRALVQPALATPEAALVVLRGALAGLQYAHAAGVVHRDVKPDNAILAVDGTSRLVDFGLAGSRGVQGRPEGTPSYAPPEQWAGAPSAPQGDVYAAGATLFECLTGRVPFPGDDLRRLRLQHERAPVPVEDLPAPVRPLVRRAMAKEPGDRFSGAQEFTEELEAAATAGYGHGWRDRGMEVLVAGVGALATLTPAGLLGGAAAGAHAGGLTVTQTTFTRTVLTPSRGSGGGSGASAPPDAGVAPGHVPSPATSTARGAASGQAGSGAATRLSAADPAAPSPPVVPALAGGGSQRTQPAPIMRRRFRVRARRRRALPVLVTVIVLLILLIGGWETTQRFGTPRAAPEEGRTVSAQLSRALAQLLGRQATPGTASSSAATSSGVSAASSDTGSGGTTVASGSSTVPSATPRGRGPSPSPATGATPGPATPTPWPSAFSVSGVVITFTTCTLQYDGSTPQDVCPVTAFFGINPGSGGTLQWHLQGTLYSDCTGTPFTVAMDAVTVHDGDDHATYRGDMVLDGYPEANSYGAVQSGRSIPESWAVGVADAPGGSSSASAAFYGGHDVPGNCTPIH